MEFINFYFPWNHNYHHKFSDDFKGNSLIKDTIDPATTIKKNENILKLAYLPPTKVYTFTKLVKCCMWSRKNFERIIIRKKIIKYLGEIFKDTHVWNQTLFYRPFEANCL